MTIRITTQMTTDMMMNDMNRNLSSIYKTYEQITSTHKFQTVGDEPLDGTKVMKYNTQLDELENWSTNINSAKDELTIAYDTLGVIDDNLQRINELVIQASNSTNSEESLAVIKEEIQGRIEAVEQLANTKYQDKYIFSGTNTSTIPYELDDTLHVTYSGTDAAGQWERNIEIAEGVTVATNINPIETFGDDTQGLFAALSAISDALEDPNSTALDISATITPLQDGMKNVVNSQGMISSQVQRLDATESINSDLSLGLTSLKSDTYDTDLVQASTDLSMYQMALEASLAAGSSILNKSTLLNYI